MSRNECDIVRDLMVLYEDDVCSRESRKFVEEHLNGCEACRKIYEGTSQELALEMPEAKEREMEERLGVIFKRSIKKWKRKYTVICCLVLCAALAATVFFAEGGVQQKLYTIPAENIEVTEIYELSTGDIFFTLHSEEPVHDWTNLGVPAGGREDPFANVDYGIRYRKNSFIGHYFLNGFEYPWDISYIYGTKSTEASYSGGDDETWAGSACSRIFYEGNGEKDAFNIWKSGDDIREAPDEVEKAALSAYYARGFYEKAETVAGHLKLDGDELMDLLGNEDNPDNVGRWVEGVVNVGRGM